MKIIWINKRSANRRDFSWICDFHPSSFRKNSGAEHCWCKSYRIAHPRRHITLFTYTFESAGHRQLSSRKTQESLFADRILKRCSNGASHSLSPSPANALLGLQHLGMYHARIRIEITTLRLSSQKYKRKRNDESWCATRRDCEPTAFNVPLFFSLSFSLPFHSIVTTLSF